MSIFLFFVLCLSFHEWDKGNTVVGARVSCPGDCGKQNDLVEGINAFAVDMYKHIEKQNKTKNVFFSPVSISTALSILLMGARGETKSQMEDVLGVSSITGNVDSMYTCLNRNLYGRTKGTELRSANKLYHDKTLKVKTEFINAITKYYEGSIEELDFKKSTWATAKINSWVAKQTNQLIKEVLQPGDIDANTVFALVNAIYFKGDWLAQFEKSDTTTQPFLSCADCSTFDVAMMYQEAPFKHYHDNVLEAQFLELPFVGEKYCMVLIVPDDRCGIDMLTNDLTAENLKQSLDTLLQDYSGRDVYLSLPKLKFKWKDELSKILEDMGMEDLFSSKVNLGGFSNDSRLDVSKVIHEAFVDVDEKGTEAAAVTVIAGGRSGYTPPPVKVNCNHPFMFLIYDKTCGVIVFLGKVMEPGKVEKINQLSADAIVECRENCRQLCFDKLVKSGRTIKSSKQKLGAKKKFKAEFKGMRKCKRESEECKCKPSGGRSGLNVC
ncbi:unnamed protein product [Owenia fusiformis]|uniref:Uncharacterized protein n=1 Tax=Owenia fusiformis TaxID=6347 RepID=A0A8J1TH51_OWEFU|nr:unnamed protein product [Owenia fusiformis]